MGEAVHGAVERNDYRRVGRAVDRSLADEHRHGGLSRPSAPSMSGTLKITKDSEANASTVPRPLHDPQNPAGPQWHTSPCRQPLSRGPCFEGLVPQRNRPPESSARSTGSGGHRFAVRGCCPGNGRRPRRRPAGSERIRFAQIDRHQTLYHLPSIDQTMAERPREKAAYEWEPVDCPVTGCPACGPRIHIRYHLKLQDDDPHASFDRDAWESVSDRRAARRTGSR